MLKVAAKYRSAIDEVTASKPLGLRRYELDDDDWMIVAHLLQVLKVSFFVYFYSLGKLNTYFLDLQGCYSILLSRR
jgi:hypothetical protein